MHDIGEYLEHRKDGDIYRLLKSRWVPDEFFLFPASGKRKLRFQRLWLLQYPWLNHSPKFDGAFCQLCALFSSLEVEKGRHTYAQALVKTPFNRWENAKETFRSHKNLDYHQNALVSAQNLLPFMKNGE